MHRIIYFTIPNLVYVSFYAACLRLVVVVGLGPISSTFVNKYGCRSVTIAGSIWASACLLSSIFAKNVLTLIITIGEFSIIGVFLPLFLLPIGNCVLLLFSLAIFAQRNFCYIYRLRRWHWLGPNLFTGK